MAPLTNIAMHVKQTQIIRLQLSAGMTNSGIHSISDPRVLGEKFFRLTGAIPSLRSGSTGILPFRFCRQPVARPLQVMTYDFHARFVLTILVRCVTPLIPGYPLLFIQPIAIPRRFVPCHIVYGTGFVGGVILDVEMVFPKSKELIGRDFPDAR